jgi:hypothetical protein
MVEHSERKRTRIHLPVACLTALTLVVVALLLTAGCGSSDPEQTASAAPVKTAITKVMPRDASAEPPWNGRFAQVNVRVAKPGAMDPGDWRVFVNGKEPELERAPSILPYAASEAVVAFMFKAPYGDLGTYEFRVVYAPKGAQKVQQSWEYKW